MRRIGIDVGGTNTDAVLMDADRVMAWVKTATTEDVTGGIVTALDKLVSVAGGDPGPLDGVMIGTTHFTNAVIERRGLTPVAAVRIGLPASASLPPFVDWPEELARVVRSQVFVVEGGHEVDGRPIVPFDRRAMRDVAARIRDGAAQSVSITSVFSPLNPACEEEAAEILRPICPHVKVSLSHRLGSIGLLERENATLMNAALVSLAHGTTRAFLDALRQSGIEAPLYLTQNDGTVMRAELAEVYPVFSFASGPTNSMRGAAFLSRLSEAIVIDVGGTTTDIGCLKAGFPRVANGVVEIGGVRTLFRMPDLVSLGLGGGSIVDPERLSVGPRSVGHRITREAMVFGGDRLTATDVAVAAGLVELGEKSRVAALDPKRVATCRQRIATLIDESVDRMKPDASALPLIAVGGAAFLVPENVSGVSRVIHVEHRAVANAVGAAIAQVSGEVDQIFTGIEREKALAEATERAKQRAVEAGAEESSLKLVEVEDLPIAYLPGDARRVRTRIVGDARARPARGR